MARSEKYRYTFVTLEGQTCTVRFDFEGWTGDSTTLIAADRPFVLQEFNTDEDLFKPVRPQLATMNIIASATGITIDDFLMDNDNDVIVYFDFGTWGNYWIGYLQQDDFQETWIDTNHIITLRASEGIGLLKNQMWSYYGSEASDRYSFLEGIQSAMDGTVQTFAEYFVFSSLYHDSMANYGSATTGLDQCSFDGKTFMTEPQIYENSYDVLTKINQAWNQNIFMYKGKWVIMRVSDQFIPTNENLQGYAQGLMGRTNIDKRYDILVGNNESVKVISPEMIRFINRRYKYEKTSFDFADFVEIIPNQTFSRGNIISDGINIKTFEIDSWIFEEGNTSSPNFFPNFNNPTTPTTGNLVRIEEYDTQYSVLKDIYASFPSKLDTNRWMRSTQIPVKAGEKISISFDARYKIVPSDDGNKYIASVLFYGLGYKYQLSEDGEWVLNNGTWTSVDSQYIKFPIGSTSGNPIPTEWNTFSVESIELPLDGYIQIALISDKSIYETNQELNFRNLTFSVISKFNTNIGAQLKAIESKYTSNDDLKNGFDNELIFQDGFSYHYKGSIFEEDESTLTDKQWFRKSFPNERFSFARQYLTSIWQNLRFNRNKVDVNFYGLTWDDGYEPIGLINTIRFIDDDPDKVYAIMNLKEIDFANSLWSATIQEIWDDNKDNANPIEKTFDADPINGNYLPSGPFIIPWSIVSAADVTYDSLTKKFTYNGQISITQNMTITLTGDINSINPSFTTATFKLYINEIEVENVTHDASTTPSEFSIALSGIYTLNPNDTMYVTISSNVGDFDVNGGQWTFYYEIPSAENYDTFNEQYIFK